METTSKRGGRGEGGKGECGIGDGQGERAAAVKGHLCGGVRGGLDVGMWSVHFAAHVQAST